MFTARGLEGDIPGLGVRSVLYLIFNLSPRSYALSANSVKLSLYVFKLKEILLTTTNILVCMNNKINVKHESGAFKVRAFKIGAFGL